MGRKTIVYFLTVILVIGISVPGAFPQEYNFRIKETYRPEGRFNGKLFIISSILLFGGTALLVNSGKSELMLYTGALSCSFGVPLFYFSFPRVEKAAKIEVIPE